MPRLAVLHEVWLTHPEVGADEVAVLAVLALHESKDHTCFPSQSLLAGMLGRSRPWICKVIGRLVELGLVIKQNRTRDDGGERSCLYRLVVPDHALRHGNDTPSPDQNSPCSDGDSVKTKPELIQDAHRTSAHEDLTVIQIQAISPDEDWQPADSDLLWAMARYPTIDLQTATERFVTRSRAKGYRYRDMSAAWRSWLVDDVLNGRLGNPKSKVSAAHNRFAAWAGVAHKVGGARHAA